MILAFVLFQVQTGVMEDGYDILTWSDTLNSQVRCRL